MPGTELLTVGDAFEDLIFVGLPHLPRPGQELKTSRFVATIGGGAVITAIAAARLGVRTAIVSALSAGAAQTLRGEGVRVANLRRRTEQPAITVALSTAGDRSFVTFSGVNERLQRRLPAALRRRRSRHVHFAFSPDDCRRWAAAADAYRRRGITTSWDFGWDHSLPMRAGFARLLASVDVVFVNELESRAYARARSAGAAERFWRQAARSTVMKLGAAGSRWLAPDREVTARAARVRVVDTTGAGDAFNAGFLFALLRGLAPRQCLRLGNFVGGESTRGAGGITALPTRSELPR